MPRPNEDEIETPVPEVIREARKTVRIPPQSNAALVWGDDDEDAAMEHLRDTAVDIAWKRDGWA